LRPPRRNASAPLFSSTVGVEILVVVEVVMAVVVVKMRVVVGVVVTTEPAINPNNSASHKQRPCCIVKHTECPGYIHKLSSNVTVLSYPNRKCKDHTV
jgi:hypothetical protein